MPELDLSVMTCPHCEHLTDDATFADEGDERRPRAGDPTICGHCAGIGIYTETEIRKATEEEQEGLKRNPHFRHAMGAAKVMSLLSSVGIEPMEGIEIPGHEGHAHRGIVLALGEGAEIPPGAIDVTMLPTELREAITGAIERAKVDAMAAEVQRYITPEVANHVLSAYGDEEASMPSMAVNALITLIRTCTISDDAILAQLNQVDEFHGYVLAIEMFAEAFNEKGENGLQMLRTIAGLDDEGPVRK